MPPALAALIGRFNDLWAGMSARLRVLAIVALAVTVLIGVVTYALTTMFVDYQVLFANLSAEDAGAVVEALKVGRVPHRIADGGQVLVPAARVHEWRLKLASQGVPSGGNIGFEIFDKNQFGLTDFAQRLNFQRALQGELARTIGQLREVLQARVHLALPAPRVFSSQDRPASASVVLRLRPGSTLRPAQVRGIVHLVTSSVEGLAPDRVTVVDSSGRMLASGLERVGSLSANQLEARGGVENDIERRVQTLLDPIVGPGRSAVRVSANVNFDQIERTEERFDPKTLIRSQTRSTENQQGSSAQPTITNQSADAKTPPPTPPAATASNRSQRDSEQTTYEIARTVERTVVAPGDLRRLSVAVLLDVPLVNGQRSPRSDEEIDRIKRLVASAAGIRADRKDELEVVQVPFDPGASAPGEPLMPQEAPATTTVVRMMPWTWLVGVALAALVIALVLWRARRRRRALEDAVGASFGGANVLPEASVAATAVADLPDLDLGVTEETQLKRQVLKVAKDHPDEMAQLLRVWMFRRKTSVVS
jgi:flagellar M-ring protein FliF